MKISALSVVAPLLLLVQSVVWVATGAPLVITQVSCMMIGPTVLSAVDSRSCGFTQNLTLQTGTAQALASAQAGQREGYGYVQITAQGNTDGVNRYSASASATYDSYSTIMAAGQLRPGYADLHPLLEAERVDSYGFGSATFGEYEWNVVGRFVNGSRPPPPGRLFPVLLGAPISIRLHAQISGQSGSMLDSVIRGEYLRVGLNYELYEADGVTPAVFGEFSALAVPEPMTSALLGGLLMMLAAGRRALGGLHKS